MSEPSRTDTHFSGMTSIKVLGEYILRNGLLMTTKTESSSTALMIEGIRAARMAGSEVEVSDCTMCQCQELRAPYEEKTPSALSLVEQPTHLFRDRVVAEGSKWGIEGWTSVPALRGGEHSLKGHEHSSLPE